MENEFLQPDYSGELDLDARLGRMPATGRVKGMFLAGIVDRAHALGVNLGRPRYVAFKDYPLGEYLELLADAAVRVHPKQPPLEGLRRLGHTVYPTFMASTIGRVTMAVAGRDMRAAVGLVPRAYTISGNTARIEILSISNYSARLHLRGVWDWPAAYQVGIMEGGFDAYEVDGEVTVEVLGLSEARLNLEWHPR
ncbi:MAG: DUF2378 family protein [Deltaproteobacteria bacterium]|nr:DUF2378 family protein [Deltaproteobacteria bacterium]